MSRQNKKRNRETKKNYNKYSISDWNVRCTMNMWTISLHVSSNKKKKREKRIVYRWWHSQVDTKKKWYKNYINWKRKENTKHYFKLMFSVVSFCFENWINFIYLTPTRDEIDAFDCNCVAIQLNSTQLKLKLNFRLIPFRWRIT